MRLPDLHHRDLAVCRAMLRDGSRTFLAASRVLPPRFADPAIALYAFCRAADDAIDLSGDAASGVAVLRARLDRIYAQKPDDDPVDRVFAAIVTTFEIPRALPDALLEGFAWDATAKRYDDLPALRAYAMRVAGTVGLMMGLIMGVRAPETLARACDLGVAMQLTNIARDVGEDARAGRLYLPLSWLQDEGIDADAFLRAPRASAGVSRVVARLLAEADTLYAGADDGISDLPRSCRIGMRVAARLYAAIGENVRAAGYDSVSRRAVVAPAHKLRLVASAAVSPAPARIMARPMLPEAVELIDSVTESAGHSGIAAARGPGAALLWTLDLFARLERLERAQRPLGDIGRA